jgi:hypothetical protein
MPEIGKTPSTETLNSLAGEYLDRLRAGTCDKDDQAYAASILGEVIRRSRNLITAQRSNAQNGHGTL